MEPGGTGGMNSDELLALFDRDQRRDVIYHGYRRERAPGIVRHVDLAGRRGFVLHSRLDAANVEGAIRDQIESFARLGQSFEWKAYEHDPPADLKARLAAHGLRAEAPEAILVLDLASAPAALLRPATHDVRRVTGPDQMAERVSIQARVWNEDRGWLGDQLAAELRHDPESLGVYLVYDQGVPAGSAWMRTARGGPFAGLWGGSILPEHRRRGLYASLIAARAQEALHRGARYLTVDVCAMSRPILERIGFAQLTGAQGYVWEPVPGA